MEYRDFDINEKELRYEINILPATTNLYGLVNYQDNPTSKPEYDILLIIGWRVTTLLKEGEIKTEADPILLYNKEYPEGCTDLNTIFAGSSDECVAEKVRLENDAKRGGA